MFFGPIYVPRALQQCYPYYLWADTGTKKIERGFGKNAGEWTGRIEIIEEEIPGIKCGMYGYILTYSRL